jgi:hypothetical protein
MSKAAYPVNSIGTFEDGVVDERVWFCWGQSAVFDAQRPHNTILPVLFAKAEHEWICE